MFLTASRESPQYPDHLEYSQYEGETKIPISQKPFKRFAKYLLIAGSSGVSLSLLYTIVDIGVY